MSLWCRLGIHCIFLTASFQFASVQRQRQPETEPSFTWGAGGKSAAAQENICATESEPIRPHCGIPNTDALHALTIENCCGACREKRIWRSFRWSMSNHFKQAPGTSDISETLFDVQALTRYLTPPSCFSFPSPSRFNSLARSLSLLPASSCFRGVSSDGKRQAGRRADPDKQFQQPKKTSDQKEKNTVRTWNERCSRASQYLPNRVFQLVVTVPMPTHLVCLIDGQRPPLCTRTLHIEASRALPSMQREDFEGEFLQRRRWCFIGANPICRTC